LPATGKLIKFTMKKIIVLLILFYSIDNFSQSIDKKEDNKIYSVNGIDVKPEFPEGLEKLNSFINENLQKAGFQLEMKTKLYAVFVIEKDGSLSAIQILRAGNLRIKEELIKILKSLPKWTPGKQNEKVVRVHYSLAIDSK
jgi:protein TonB